MISGMISGYLTYDNTIASKSEHFFRWTGIRTEVIQVQQKTCCVVKIHLQVRQASLQ